MTYWIETFSICVFAERLEASPIEKQLGLVCTETHLLVLGALKSNANQSGANDSDVNDVADDVSGKDEHGDGTNESGVNPTRQLKLFLRIRKRYDVVATSKTPEFLLCARGGILDIFQVRQKAERCFLLHVSHTGIPSEVYRLL